MAKKKNNFIQGAIKHKGALTARAKAAGMSVAEYASKPHKDPEIQREVNLYHTLMKMHHNG